MIIRVLIGIISIVVNPTAAMANDKIKATEADTSENSD